MTGKQKSRANESKESKQLRLDEKKLRKRVAEYGKNLGKPEIFCSPGGLTYSQYLKYLEGRSPFPDLLLDLDSPSSLHKERKKGEKL